MSDRWSEVVGRCPCGKGSVVEHVTESDHPWIMNHLRSRNTVLECSICSKEWHLSGSEFVQIASEREVERIRQEKMAMELELQNIATDTVNAFFEIHSYPSMKAEWEALRKFGLYHGSLRTYRNRRRGRRPIPSLLSACWNIPWIAKNCLPAQRTRRDWILKRIEHLSAEEREAGKLIVRQPFLRS